MIVTEVWEYQILMCDVLPDIHDDAEAMGSLLKSRGELGWELTSVVRADTRREFYFKRPGVDPELTGRG